MIDTDQTAECAGHYDVVKHVLPVPGERAANAHIANTTNDQLTDAAGRVAKKERKDHAARNSKHDKSRAGRDDASGRTNARGDCVAAPC